MARREWSFMGTCGHEGCNERFTYRYQTRRDLVNSFEVKNYSNGRWRCVRHTRPDEVLSLTNLKTVAEVVSERKHGHLYFGNFGFVHGLGFKAFANDFPEGTRLIVTAEIVLPNATQDLGGAA